MPHFGRYQGFPFEFGGRDSDHRAEHMALLRQLEPGFSPEEDSPTFWETYGEALAIAIMWAVNKRLSNSMIPARMMENLPTWEEATKVRLTPPISDVQRRAGLAAKLAGVASNALVQIEISARRILGDNFHSIVLVNPDDAIRYWPGINPGPPGFAWTSSVALIGIRIVEENISDNELSARKSQILNDMQDKMPVWMDFAVGVGDSFIVNQSIVGKAFL